MSLIFDFGGATIDISLVKLSSECDGFVVEELASTGLSYGGTDIDEGIFNDIFLPKYDIILQELTEKGIDYSRRLFELIKTMKERLYEDDEEMCEDIEDLGDGSLKEFVLSREDVIKILEKHAVKEKIFAVNSKGITNIARVSREIGSKVINISYSDVFDGNSKEAYTEDSIKNPISIYGQALADGETSLKKEMNQYYIIRNSFVYGLDQNNYFYKLINQLKNESSLSIPDDIYISPVNACDLSSLIIDLIKKSISAKAFFGKNSAPSYGIYNFADENSVSLYEFAKEVIRLLIKHGKTKNVCNINPCSKNDLEEYKSFLNNSSLNNSKICKEFKIKTPLWTKSLEKLIKDKRFI